MVRSGRKTGFIASVVRDLSSPRIVSAKMEIHLIPRAIQTRKTAGPFISERWLDLAVSGRSPFLSSSSSLLTPTATFHMAVSSIGTCEKLNYEIYESPFRVSPIKGFFGKLAFLLAPSLFAFKLSYTSILRRDAYLSLLNPLAIICLILRYIDNHEREMCKMSRYKARAFPVAV